MIFIKLLLFAFLAFLLNIIFYYILNRKILRNKNNSTLLLELRNTLASLQKQIYIDLQKMK